VEAGAYGVTRSRIDGSSSLAERAAMTISGMVVALKS
jgi:hypothetical protein